MPSQPQAPIIVSMYIRTVKTLYLTKEGSQNERTRQERAGHIIEREDTPLGSQSTNNAITGGPVVSDAKQGVADGTTGYLQTARDTVNSGASAAYTSAKNVATSAYNAAAHVATEFKAGMQDIVHPQADDEDEIGVL
ncbi:hypothetical protein HDU85_000828 [Gaertneriomyces sp. JEL0708]|nr:hypothetical protein HDU85_000828 [Gaertneriomyces sp. JEL0708]